MTKSCIFRGILFYCILQTILADGHVNIQVEILQYDNPLGTSYHGENRTSERKCCDNGTIPTCSKIDSCDSQFYICLGSVSNGKCNGPQATTKILKDTISFTKSYDNSMMYSFTWDHWPSGLIRYIVYVNDKDVGMGDLIDSFTSTSEVKVATSYENSTSHVISLKNYVSLDLGIRIWCQDGYSGRDCSHKCSSSPFTICTKTNDTALLQSCYEHDVCTIKLGTYTLVNFTPVVLRNHFTPVVLRNHLTYFILKEICIDAHNIQVEILHFTLKGLVQFKASCDNSTLSGLQFTTHIYVINLVNKAFMRTYFRNLPLIVPTVDRDLSARPKVIMMLRPISYHDASSTCGQNGCIVKLSVCLYPKINGQCQSQVSMQASMTNSPWRFCDGYFPDIHHREQGYAVLGATTWPTIYVDVKYVGRNTTWQDHQQIPLNYSAEISYKTAKPLFMTFNSGNKTFVLETMLWCEQHHYGKHCQHSNCSATGNKMCDNTGHFVCKPGYGGNHCTDLNECQTEHPCQNGGTCQNIQGSFSCKCKTGWTGRFCDVDIDECSLGLCTGVLQCTNYSGRFHCTCASGFRGKYCTDSNECSLAASGHICYHNSSCINKYGSYYCNCPSGFTGQKCDLSVDQCKMQVCHVNNTLSCRNSNGGYICNCKPGWTGNNCETDINECISSPCINGTCINTDGSFICRCYQGFAGKNCDQDFDECSIVTCANNGTCLNLPFPERYKCKCMDGWDPRSRCHHGTDPCNKIKPCVNGSCQNKIGNYMCTCNNGWSGKNCTIDVDECKSFICMHGGKCSNTLGGYSCACTVGWRGSNCSIDVDECAKSNQCKYSSNCTNTPGSYSCACPNNWSGKHCDKDVNECYCSPCLHNSTCFNNNGGYSCACPHNWEGKNCENDVNECLTSPCKNSGSCYNTAGSFNCKCSHNWTGKTCETDINECTTYIPCKHNGVCSNTAGGFNCSCDPQWTGITCEKDVNECQVYSPCNHGGTCQNTRGGYMCICDNGWTGRNCSVDIDECYTIRPCKNNGICQNSNGGYACACAVGWSGQTCSSDIDECQRYNPCSHGGVCNNIDGGYTCVCPPNWEGHHCEVEIDTCTVTPCKNNGQCTKIQDGYTCLCSHRWTGTNCEYDVYDIIKSECTNSGWNISVDMLGLRQIHPAITVNEIFFGDNSCKGQLVANHLVFLQGFQSCLTAEQQISSSEVLYRNILFSKTLDQMQSSPNMQTIWTYSVECKVGSFAATASLIKDKTRPPIPIESNSKSINITFFKDPGFMIPLSGNPVRSNVGDDVYVKVFTTTTNWNIKMRLDTCYVTPDVNIDNTPYYVINHGCEVDSNTHIISESTHETRFVFQDFENVDKNGINIYCNATFCDSDDFSPGCAESCVLN